MGQSAHGGRTRLVQPLRECKHVDLLRSTDNHGYSGCWRDIGRHHEPISNAHGVERAQDLGVRVVGYFAGNSSLVDVAFGTTLPNRPNSGSTMSKNAAVEQKNIVGFGDRLVLRFCCGLSGTAR